MVTETQLLITSKGEDVVVEADLRTLSLQVYVGKNMTGGEVHEGHRTDDVRLNRPRGIASTQNRSKVFIGVVNAESILALNVSNDWVTLAYHTGVGNRYLAMLPGDEGLLISITGGVVHLSFNDSSVTYVIEPGTLVNGNVSTSMRNLVIVDDRFCVAAGNDIDR